MDVKVEIHERFESGLPPADDHPYRTGAWRPQVTEYDAWDLDVDGVIPDDLAGVYLRNTENPLLPPIARYHPFDGDGMLHSIRFGGGAATYHNRFVRTDGFLAEREELRSLWAGVAELPSSAERTDGCHGPRPRMKDGSSTDVIVHRGSALSSFWMCGDLYRLDPVTLDDLGKEDWGGHAPPGGVSAHPKVDEHTGELLFFNYTNDDPYMRYGEVDAAGVLTNVVDVTLPGPRLPHDMAFTEHYAILCDLPMFHDPIAAAEGVYYPRFYPELPARFAIVPRGGTADRIRWFEAAPTFVLHWINAYEDGDEIVLDGFFQNNPSPAKRPDLTVEQNLFRYLDLHTLESTAHRWRFNLVTGECREEPLGDDVREFGTINGRHGGRPYRYAYNAVAAEGWFGFVGVSRLDVETGDQETYLLPDGVYASETTMAPRVGSGAEDDGYLVTMTMDTVDDRSECLVFDAANLADGPLARIALPERICSGTHATWAGIDRL